MQDPSNHPYELLTPDVVVASVESCGFLSDGRMLALNSYENRVYQVGIESASPIIAKFYRPGRWTDAAILEEHQFSLELAHEEIPAVAPLQREGITLFEHAGFRFALFPRQGGYWPELATREDREWMGRFLGRIHAVGRRRRFKERPTFSVERFGFEPHDYLLESDWIPDHLRDAYHSVSEDVLERVQSTLEDTPASQLRLHGDCHPGNVLWTTDGPHFVDLDDCLTGPAVQDLWMLLSGNRREMAEQLSQLLQGYQQFADFDYRELVLIEALRSLRIIHYAAWLARRWDDPAFPRAFPWFAEAKFWEQHVLNLREQFAALEEGPLELV